MCNRMNVSRVYKSVSQKYVRVEVQNMKLIVGVVQYHGGVLFSDTSVL